ncbi:MAG: formate dehydrogenase accessory protein FdhE [Syntrophobacteraceae bacterium]|nr:formate dehydrogenase accessory protein FdhE [Syntrophobacteraceae bacterium]
MLPVELCENLTMDAEAAVEDLCGRAPELSRIVAAFAALAKERNALKIDLAGMPVPDLDEEAFGAGEPFLGRIDWSIFYGEFLRSARRLLPVLGKVFSPVACSASGLLAALEERSELPEMLIKASLTGDFGALGPLAEKAALPAKVLSFLAAELLKPFLRALEERTGGLADNALWCKGRCPVCGGGPDYGVLKEKGDPSEFLVSKSGRLWLHCPLCGHFWRFVRLVCPACGENDHEQLDVLTVRGRERDRIHSCRSCGRYLPVIDLVESGLRLHPDLAPLGFIPLDILAWQEGYAPISLAPWNQLG